MLVLLSMAFVVTPKKEAAAQGPKPTGVISFCFDNSSPTGNLLYVDAEKCPPGPTIIPLTRPVAHQGLCIAGSPPQYTALASPGFDVNGQPRFTTQGGQEKCLPDYNSPNPNTPVATLVRFPANTGTPPPGQTPTNTNTNNNSGGPILVPNPVNGNTNNNNGSGSTIAGTCETGFHKVGPLCVPNSPFNPNSIAGGNATASSLAVRIIEILLYFAAIVAVVMIIIGGYQVMTAGGDTAKTTNGRKTLTNAVIGLAIVILAYIIIQAVLSFLTK